MVAVRQHKYGALDAAQELFDDHRCRSIAEHTAEHLFQLFLSLFQGRQDQYTFTGAKSVCFQHVGGFERFEECQSLVQCTGRYAPVAGCRYVVALHEFLGELFAAFQLGSFLRRADDGNLFQAGIVLETVVDTFYQWVFRPYYNHVDVLFKSECS